MDIKKIANAVYRTVDSNYPIPRFFSDSIKQDITDTLKEQFVEETKEINLETDRMIKESNTCTQEKIIGLAYDKVLLNLGLRNEGPVETP